MTGLEDVANFTSLTRVGYQAYVDLLKSYLPKKQALRIGPVGLAFLTVYEEDFDLWEKLFHSDHLHARPHVFSCRDVSFTTQSFEQCPIMIGLSKTTYHRCRSWHT